MSTYGSYPGRRMRRLRGSAALREMLAGCRVEPSDLIAPIFVQPGEGFADEIASMPGQFRFSVDRAVAFADRLAGLGVRAVLLFGVVGPADKDEFGTLAWADDGPVQHATRAIKALHPEMLVFTDACLCEYTSHGHCGPISEDGRGVDNDETLAALRKVALSQAGAGADFVAPSGMMDGMVGAIRSALDEADRGDVGILSYAVKYASAYYGPFRDAADSAPTFGDRRTYQMDPAAGPQHRVEAALDAAEGADILMVKPALPYLDILADLRSRFDLPLAAYHVSGEYAQVKAAAARGWIEEKGVVLEAMASLKRAGADLIVTYYAESLAEWTG